MTDTDAYLIEPSTDVGPAAGVAETGVNSVRRETAFAKLAAALGLEDVVPRVELLKLDGKEAMMTYMLPPDWEGLGKRMEVDAAAASKVFGRYRDTGQLHRMAVLDFISGNPDRHNENVLIDEAGEKIQLIDAGSAFAGEDFDPAYDSRSFVPCYLRAWSGPRFNTLPLEEKLQRMPRIRGEQADRFSDWLADLDPETIRKVVEPYLDPTPTLHRLTRLQFAAKLIAADEAVNRLWVTT